jgi:pilus assembly protein CpaE
LHLLPAPADAVEAAEVDDETMSRILTLARRAYDYVIVDTFPLFDRVVMAVLDLSERTYVVLESVVPTLVGGAKMIQLLDSLNYHRDRQRVVLNRYSNRFVGNLKPADVAARLGREVDHVVPYEKQVVIAMNMGNPYILHSRWFSRFHRAINRIANEVAELGQMPSTVRETAGPARPPVDGAVNITPAEVTT